MTSFEQFGGNSFYLERKDITFFYKKHIIPLFIRLNTYKLCHLSKEKGFCCMNLIFFQPVLAFHINQRMILKKLLYYDEQKIDFNLLFWNYAIECQHTILSIEFLRFIQHLSVVQRNFLINSRMIYSILIGIEVKVLCRTAEFSQESDSCLIVLEFARIF